jgi:hypothetical protein
MKAELDKIKAAWIIGQVKINLLTRAVKDLKISADRFAAQIPTLEDKVKHLENKVVERLNEIRTRGLCLEHTTPANDDYKKQNTQLTKKLESNSFGHIRAFYYLQMIFWLAPLQLLEPDVELNILKAMVDNTIAFFYPGESSSKVRAPLDARQSADNVLGDYSYQYEVVDESSLDAGWLGHGRQELCSNL